MSVLICTLSLGPTGSPGRQWAGWGCGVETLLYHPLCLLVVTLGRVPWCWTRGFLSLLQFLLLCAGRGKGSR